MATEKPRFSVTFSEETFCKIKKYKKENRISTQSKAVAQLVSIAIHELERTGAIKKASPYSEEAQELAKDYDGLDDHGKRIVRMVTDEEKARCKEAAEKAAFLKIAGDLYDSEKEPDIPVSSVKESGAV